MRFSNKLVSEIKWLPYSSRFDIWGESRSMILDYKNKCNEKKFKLFYKVAKKIKEKLEFNGVTDEKMILSLTDKYTRHLKGEEFVTR
jgi:hypothetical protein